MLNLKNNIKRRSTYNIFNKAYEDAYLSLGQRLPTVTNNLEIDWKDIFNGKYATIYGLKSIYFNGSATVTCKNQSIKSIGFFFKPNTNNESLFNINETIFGKWINGNLSLTGFASSVLIYKKQFLDWWFIGISQSDLIDGELELGFADGNYFNGNIFNIIEITEEISNLEWKWIANHPQSTPNEIRKFLNYDEVDYTTENIISTGVVTFLNENGINVAQPEIWDFPLDFTTSDLNITEININITR